VAPSAAGAGAARKVVTAVFGDLVGSTALQETLDPETARQVMSRFYEAMRGVIARHGGHLDKFVGDGVVVVFGVPVVGEHDAERAVRCAHAMVAALAGLDAELDRGWGVRLRMRVGVKAASW
jgi:class 3 adenylate cyclase